MTSQEDANFVLVGSSSTDLYIFSMSLCFEVVKLSGNLKKKGGGIKKHHHCPFSFLLCFMFSFYSLETCLQDSKVRKNIQRE